MLVAIAGVDPLDTFAGKMMSKHCAQLVHDSGGVYGLTERAQADRVRREEALQAVIQQKSKRIRTLIISADNLRIARDKWKLVLLHQKAAGKALPIRQLVPLVGWLLLARWFVFDGQRSTSGALARSRK